VSSVGNRNRTPTDLADLASFPAFTWFFLLSPSPVGLPDCGSFLSVCGVVWSRMLRSCCSNDSRDDEPDVDLPGVVTIDFSGDTRLLTSDVTPLTSVKSGSSVIPVSLSEILYNAQMIDNNHNLYQPAQY